MKIVLEHSDIQKAIAAHVAAIGYSIHPDDVQIEQLDDGTFEAPLTGVEFNPGTNAMTTPVVDKPKQTRAKRTPKVEPTPVAAAVKAEEVDSAVDEATLAAYREAQAAKEQPVIDVPALTETPDNISVPKATAGTVSEAQTAAVVDRMLAEEPAAEDGSGDEATALPTAAQLIASKPSGFLRKKLEAQQAAAAQAQSE